MRETSLRLIADAIARSGLHHRRSAIFVGLAALAACGLVAVADEPPAKGVALLFAAVFAVITYRSVRTSNQYFDLGSSPVLRAIAREPGQIARVSRKPSPRGIVLVVVEDADGHQLPLRIEPHRAEAVDPLLAALAEIAPQAQIDREPQSEP